MSLDEPTRKKIREALELGMPINIVADYVELELAVIQKEIADDPLFKRMVNKATADCMYARLQGLKGLTNWQALAFILTSLWPMRFGRNSKGVPNLARLLERPGLLDFSRLDDLDKRFFDYLMAKLNGHDVQRPTEPKGGGAEAKSRATAD